MMQAAEDARLGSIQMSIDAASQSGVKIESNAAVVTCSSLAAGQPEMAVHIAPYLFAGLGACSA